MAAPHIPVMLEEVLQYLSPKPGETYVDGTFGAGGYSRGILAACACNVIGVDQDPSVQETADQLKSEYDERFQFIQGNFGDINDLLKLVNPESSEYQVDAIVLDIGVSSMQIDQAERGFSFMREGPLDMRMSQQGRSAADFVNQAGEEELANVIYRYGGERRSRSVARAIVEARAEEPIETTTQLARIIRSVVRRAKDNIDPATRSFQAIRIWINDELGALERGLEAAVNALKPDGRLVVVTFHSLEDAIVKRFLKEKSGAVMKSVSRHLPVIEDPNAKPVAFRILTKKPAEASRKELSVNVRARSAKLRAAIRLKDSTTSNEVAS